MKFPRQIAALLLTVSLPTFASAALVTGNIADQEIYASPPHKFVGQSTARIGLGGASAANAQFVIPFALPTLMAGESIDTSEFTFDLTAVASFGADLSDMNVYGIQSSASAAVTDSDFLDVTSLPSGAVLIQASIATRTSTLGQITTDATGNANLASWVQSLYDGGASGGDFAFIGLALSDPGATSTFRYYTAATANTAIANQPTLDITVSAVPEPSSLLMLGLGAMAFAYRKRSKKNAAIAV